MIKSKKENLPKIGKTIVLTLVALFLLVFVVFQLIGFIKYFGLVEFLYLDIFYLGTFLPYIIVFFLVFFSLLVVEDLKQYLQLERILSQIFWIVYLVFAIINRESLFTFYVRNNGDTSNLLSNLIVIELFFLLAMVFTGLTHRTEIRGYLAYAFYALSSVSFIFFLIRISVQWEPVMKQFILMTEFWLEIAVLITLSICLLLSLIKPKLQEEKTKT